MKYILSIIIIILTACTTTKYVPVETIRDHHTTDTLQLHDTITVEATTIIREVDSLTLAAFGIQLDNQQRAWLIEKNNIQRQISNTSHVTHDTIRDTIPIIKEIEKVVTKKNDIPIIPLILVSLILMVLILTRTHKKNQ